MIEPVRHGHALLNEIAASDPEPGSLFVWWLGQSGFLVKSCQGLLAVDLYLSDHLTTKYAATDRPHVRMTRAPLRGRDLSGVDLVLASHRHSDHLDPETFPELLAASTDTGICPASDYVRSMPEVLSNMPAFASGRSPRPTNASIPTRTDVTSTLGL
jgi:hypothetical protein